MIYGLQLRVVAPVYPAVPARVVQAPVHLAVPARVRVRVAVMGLVWRLLLVIKAACFLMEVMIKTIRIRVNILLGQMRLLALGYARQDKRLVELTLQGSVVVADICVRLILHFTALVVVLVIRVFMVLLTTVMVPTVAQVVVLHVRGLKIVKRLAIIVVWVVH